MSDDALVQHCYGLRTLDRQYRDYSIRRRLRAPELERGHAISLEATNYVARIKLAEAVLPIVTAAIERQANAGPVYFMSLTPGQYAVPLDDAPDFNLMRLKAWARHYVGNINFFGVVEAAYYSNWNVCPTKRQPTVSWHVHIFPWNTTKREMAAIVKAINEKTVSLIPLVPAAHCDAITPGHLQTVMLYALKAPEEYRVYAKRRERVDGDTGEITKRDTGRFKQKSRPLRPGDRRRMSKVLENRYLDQMVFAGGAGKPLLKALRTEINRERLRRNL